MAVSELDRQQIAGVIEQYRHGFATMDVEGLKAIWDQDYDHIIYIADACDAGWSPSICSHTTDRGEPGRCSLSTCRLKARGTDLLDAPLLAEGGIDLRL